MQLRRVYHEDKLVRDEDGDVIECRPGAVKGVEVLRADHGVQRFSPRMVSGGFEEGWLSVMGGTLTIYNQSGDDLVYMIIRFPGHYCCHCDGRIQDASSFVKKGKTTGQLHVEQKHSGKKSPDPSNPYGYREEKFYTCVNTAASKDVRTKEQAMQMERGIREAAASKRIVKVTSNG